jgi:O-antigen ligase
MPLAGTGKHFDRLTIAADWLAVAVAMSLPWSTSATGILLVIWLLVLIPTLDWASLRRELMTPAGGLPILLVALGVVGMVWADVSWLERWKGLESFLKLLVIPLLFVQFRRSDRATCVFIGYGVACILLFLMSSIFYIWPNTAFLFTHDPAVPVKNAATQSGEFVTCIFGFLFLAVDAFVTRRWLWLLGLAFAAIGMLVNIMYVATGRTALVIIPVLLAILAFKRLSARGILTLFVAACVLGSVGWFSSPYLRDRVSLIWTDAQKYQATNDVNSSGQRLDFWKNSAAFVMQAPVFGHGTGSITSLFRNAAAERNVTGFETSNPHNQTFTVAIQLGLVGALVLWAMWIAHLLLFRGSGLAEWIGLVVVVQNIIGSLFNSHLFDFGQGWVYMLGVGVAGGVALKNRAARTP